MRALYPLLPLAEEGCLAPSITANKIVAEIIEAVADSKDIDPSGLQMSIGEYTDREAIERFAENTESSWRLSFELPQRGVYVESGGDIIIEKREEQSLII
jgi:hypothetical protein